MAEQDNEASGNGLEEVRETRSPEEEEVAAAAAAATAEEAEIHVEFMDGEVLTAKLAPAAAVHELKRVVAGQREKPPGTIVKLMWEGRVLRDAELVGPLANLHVQGLWVKADNSYLVRKEGETVLLTEGDAEWHEETARKAQVDEARWVPKPASNTDEPRNLARLSEGVTLATSTNMMGAEKLLNVLRLGSKHGDPRYVDGDSSFIFGENDRNQTMVVDFGRTVHLLRIGSMCYGDRWLNAFQVDTTKEATGEAWTAWGSDRDSRRQGGVAYFDREATAVRRIRFKTSSGHYHGAGARFGPIFAWGFD